MSHTHSTTLSCYFFQVIAASRSHVSRCHPVSATFEGRPKPTRMQANLALLLGVKYVVESCLGRVYCITSIFCSPIPPYMSPIQPYFALCNARFLLQCYRALSIGQNSPRALAMARTGLLHPFYSPIAPALPSL